MGEETEEVTEKPEVEDRESKFISAYLGNGMNGTQAAITAGYSEKGARVQAHRMLTNANVRSAINEHLKEVAMSADEVLARLTAMARGTIEDFVDLGAEKDAGYPNAFQTRPTIDLRKASKRGALGLLKEYNVNDKGEVSIKLHDPAVALDKLGRYHNLFADNKTDVKVEIKLTPDEAKAKVLDLFRTGAERARQQPSEE